MATWTLTFLPIQQVILNKGRIEFGKLAKILMELDPRRFNNEETVDRAISTYCPCLENIAGIIVFNKNAGNYSKYLMERSIQFALHESVKNMEEWQLYPMIIRTNSKRCYVGIPWEEIPKDLSIASSFKKQEPPFDNSCDFREGGEDSCKTGCGVSEEVLKKYGFL